MIVVEKLTKEFKGNQVLKGIDLRVEAGEVVAIIGPSGSGKTTLLRCLNLLETPTSGSITVGDITIDGSRPVSQQQGLIRQLRQQVGFVFQNFNLFPHRTALENVVEGPVVVKKVERESALTLGRTLLAKVGLAGKEDAYPRRLSGGQQQRVAIARALAMEPQVILFDEPTSALDPELVGEVLTTIRALAEEKRTMVIVTHEMSFARDVANRVIFIDKGVIVEQGDAKELFANPKQERTKQFLERTRADPTAPFPKAALHTCCLFAFYISKKIVRSGSSLVFCDRPVATHLKNGSVPTTFCHMAACVSTQPPKRFHAPAFLKKPVQPQRSFKSFLW